MHRISAQLRGRVIALAVSISIAATAVGCGAIGFTQAPAKGYVWGSQQPLRIAIVNQAGPEWSSAVRSSLEQYEEGSGGLVQFQTAAQGANIVITIKTYTDSVPPDLDGYDFPQGAGGFATVYDAQGLACNYPPSTLPLNCSGEITRTEIWLNLAIPAGSDIEARRERLLLHELGHAMGLTRHAPTLDIGMLTQRYGWDRR